jgi:putative oxidoreductase
MRAFQTEDLGKLLLRLTLGILLILHGIAKIFGDIGWLTGMLQNIGLPGFFAYGVYIGEVLAPLLVILGLYARVGALVIAVNMLVAIWLVHMNELFTIGKTGGWALELQGFFLFVALSVALIGPGRFSVKEN